MFWNIVRKEIAVQLLTSRFILVLLLSIVLAVISTVVMVRDYELRMDNYRVLTQQDQPYNVIKKPEPLSVFVKGLDELTGRGMTVSAVIYVGSSQDSVNRLFSLFRQIDLHFVFSVIMSLAAILFTFDIVSGEKQNQTLKLLLVNSVGRGTVLAAKWLAAVILVAVPCIVALLAALLQAQFSTPEILGGDSVLRIGLLAATLLLQIAAFASIGILVSVATHRPASSLVFAVLVWAVLVFVVPPVAEMWATHLAQGKTMERHEEAVKELWIGGIFRYIKSTGFHEGQGPEWARYSGDFAGAIANEYRDYLNSEERRYGLMRMISALSPTGAFNSATWAIAATGPGDAQHFKRAVLKFQSQRLKDRITAASIDNKESGVPAEYEPARFSAYERPLGEALVEEILPAAATLAVQALLIFLIAYFLFTRYDAR